MRPDVKLNLQASDRSASSKRVKWLCRASQNRKNKSQTDWNFTQCQCSHNLTKELCLLLLSLVVNRSAIIIFVVRFQAQSNINGLQIAPPAGKPSLDNAATRVLIVLQDTVPFNG